LRHTATHRTRLQLVWTSRCGIEITVVLTTMHLYRSNAAARGKLPLLQASLRRLTCNPTSSAPSSFAMTKASPKVFTRTQRVPLTLIAETKNDMRRCILACVKKKLELLSGPTFHDARNSLDASSASKTRIQPHSNLYLAPCKIRKTKVAAN